MRSELSLADAAFGRTFLQERITGTFPLARHIGIVVERTDAAGIVLSAPLAANANDKGTAFGGSLFSVAVLTGWAWVTWYLAGIEVDADAVIQESNIRYLSPVHGPLRATLAPPPLVRIARFHKMLRRSGRGRIGLDVEIHQGATLATRFEGIYAAVVRKAARQSVGATSCLEN